MPSILAVADLRRRGESPAPFLDRALAGTVLFHPAAIARYTDGAVGLLRHDFAERQRTVWTRDNVWVLLDGWIHNGVELRRKLGLREDAPDEEIVFRAHRAGSDRHLEAIEGAWAWILWDGAARRLRAARDVLGRRSLFFGERDGWAAWGSQLHAVARALDLSEADLSESNAAAFLTVGKARRGESPYRNVRALFAGHAVAADTTVRTASLQRLAPEAGGISGNADECAAAFREILSASLRRILQRPGGVWSDLSGGLDSSTLVCLAAQLAAQGHFDSDRLTTLSVVFDAARASDERPWIAEVVRATGARNVQLSGDVLHPFQDMLGGGLAWDYPTLELLTWRRNRDMVDRLNAAGARTYLKGLGAEAVLFGELVPPIYLADLLRQGRLLDWARDATQWRRAFNDPLLHFLWKYSIRPLVQPRHLHVESPTEIPGWVSRSLVSRSGVRHWRTAMWSDVRTTSRSTQWELEHLARIPEGLHKGPVHRTCDVELPFLAEPVVRRCLATPWPVRILPTENKRLVRRGMAGVLPDAIRTRTRTVIGNASMLQALKWQWNAVETLMTDSLVHRAGWVDENAVKQELVRARHGACAFLPGALRPVALEVWMRSRFDARA